MREFTVYLSDDLHLRLTAEAERTGLKKAEIVRSALRAALASRLTVAYKKKKPRAKKVRLKAARDYVWDLLDGEATTPYAGRRWQKCPYLFKAAHGKYHCMEKKEAFPKCFHGCKAYYPKERKKPST